MLTIYNRNDYLESSSPNPFTFIKGLAWGFTFLLILISAIIGILEIVKTVVSWF